MEEKNILKWTVIAFPEINIYLYLPYLYNRFVILACWTRSRGRIKELQRASVGSLVRIPLNIKISKRIKTDNGIVR
jgi:hypothetical protein